jgi:hypothetical protein
MATAVISTAVIYDGSFNGLLSAVFLIYEHKLTDARIFRSEVFQPAFFGGHILADTDIAKAGRVWKGLQKRLSAESMRDIYLCFLSEVENVENILLSYSACTDV